MAGLKPITTTSSRLFPPPPPHEGRIRLSTRAVRLVKVTVITVVAVALIVALIGPITDIVATHDVNAIVSSLRAGHLQSARETARTEMLTLGAGVFAAGALIYTARNFHLSREGQVTDRYTRAIEQLGSDKLDVRIGAIYALERVARDSAKDHPTVMAVLAAFVREHSSERWPPPVTGTDTFDRTRPDVQAAITVIGRRDVTNDRESINLADSYLPGADITDADLGEASLTGIKLPRANLSGSNLTNADLTRADLTSANFTRADLTGVRLSDANLTNATLGMGHSYKGWTSHGLKPMAHSPIIRDLRDHGANLSWGNSHPNKSQPRGSLWHESQTRYPDRRGLDRCRPQIRDF